MTIDGTVSEILGYPAWFLINDARIPAKSAPTKAAAAGGNEARSTSSSRRVLATAPISAAVAASFHGLLNIIENPNTPQKLKTRRSMICMGTDMESAGKSTGCRCKSSAISHAVMVATTMIMIA